MPRYVAGKKLTDKQVETLLTKGKTGKIKGFKGKNGSFEARLCHIRVVILNLFKKKEN
ncbi:topoisomerase C-terminal repeat-containing protein [Salsuginibacillus kocurii]|uniref:topoisomerase C-terminal repeat-containing protein n=1 Tax=Salsuginibacillus kocurii TaxID=427078 RepID=UPI0003A7CA93